MNIQIQRKGEGPNAPSTPIDERKIDKAGSINPSHIIESEERIIMNYSSDEIARKKKKNQDQGSGKGGVQEEKRMVELTSL